ncbi:glycosyltransferase family 4 protein [Pseudomonas sp. SCB32]|uniref:glycosyltransferase family 4 protein n=1 Tax=Pseudomonas sp. SCB32 TaxID=2653853 RepID=UPI0012651E33|nr:glycosyltransferase family 4 protein [Pseudomonas sp. SCB32]
MRVLHFFKTYYPDSFGGIEQVIYQLAEGCRNHGVSSKVLTLSQNPERERTVGTHTVRRSQQTFNIASTGFSLSALSDFKELASEADIIHYHFPWPFMDMIHFASRIKKPSIVSYHSDIVRQKSLLKLYTPLMHKFLSSMDSIVASSPNYAQSSDVLLKHHEKVCVIPYGLEESSYPAPSAESLQTWRERIGPRFFLFVGMLRYYKGLNYLLEALSGLDYPLVIAGSGPLEAELKMQASRLGLKNVHFLGAVSDHDKAALLKLCHAFVFPSHLRSEAFGISLLEAAMFGKPLISCEIGTGTSFINVDGITGLSVSPADPMALRGALMKIWSDQEFSRECGEAARHRFESGFSANTMAESYARLYESLIGR